MNFVITLANQPFFRLLAAVLVLLLTDMRPEWGIYALMVWVVWVFVARDKAHRTNQ